MMITMISMAFALDLLVGDPAFLYHPVRLMGRVISGLLPLVERSRHKVLAGALFPMSLILLSLATGFLIRLLPEPLSFTLSVYVLFSSLAAHSLAKEALNVLNISDPAEKRNALSYLCSRDTEKLDCRGVLSTLFETVSENAVDGVLAPLFYMFLFAPFGMSVEAVLIYKSVSTCDSMVGYKNARFIEIGKISARLDDVLNWIPARISVFFILSAGLFLRKNVANGFRIYRRDRYRHSSPNSAHPMSAFAGLFEVRIGGPVPYFGVLAEKPYIGDDDLPLTPKIVFGAVVTMLLSSVFMYFSFCVFLYLLGIGMV